MSESSNEKQSVPPPPPPLPPPNNNTSSSSTLEKEPNIFKSPGKKENKSLSKTINDQQQQHQQQGESAKIALIDDSISGHFIDIDSLNDNDLGIHIFSSQDEVYTIKVPKYKEIKQYIKGEKLGKGKFGTVREFVHKHTLKRFAGKIIRRWAIEKDPHLRLQINKELAITYHLHHRNVMRVYDLYATKEKIYMFCEFCAGALSEFLHAYNQLPKCQSRDYFVQILDGLEYLHSRGIIHRDVKPDNILVDHANVIKLADFGCAQDISIFSENDTVGGNDGSPLYHPPELFADNVLTYSGSKIDIWAAGVVLHEMLTGKTPFLSDENLSRMDKIEQLLKENPNYPAIVRGDILLVELFNKIFEKNFTKRISIEDIHQNLWIQKQCLSKYKHFLPYPQETRKVDCYRGTTVLTRIHERYYPTPKTEADKRVDFHTSEASREMRPLVRGQRVMAPTKVKVVMNVKKGVNYLG